MKTHNYTNRAWGHDYIITKVENGGLQISLMGWGIGIKPNDYILLVSQSSEKGTNPDTRYQIDSIEYFPDPLDMWSAKAIFAPR